MRLTPVLCLMLAASPLAAETSLRIAATSPEAAPDAEALQSALRALLAGERADCPVTLDAAGSVAVDVSHVPGPPEGWSLALAAPPFAASGAKGEVATAAAGILDLLCPRQGEAATRGPWEASGGGAQITITGRVANLMAGFTLEGQFPGGAAVFEYAPVTMGGGAVSYSLSGSGVTGSGEGLYTLEAMPGDVYILSQTTDGCIDGIPNSCRTNTDTITLTPVGR